jgi:hypothetical protein
MSLRTDGSMSQDKEGHYLGSHLPSWLGFAAWWTLGATLLAWIWFSSTLE